MSNVLNEEQKQQIIALPDGVPPRPRQCAGGLQLTESGQRHDEHAQPSPRSFAAAQNRREAGFRATMGHPARRQGSGPRPGAVWSFLISNPATAPRA